MLPRGVVGVDYLILRCQVRRHASPLVAELRLDYHGKTDFFRCLPSLVRAFDGPAFGHGHATRSKQLPCELFVLGNRLANRSRAVGLAGKNPPLLRAMPELN